jgi:S-DNA-T family DNA segregation ATPase FtsK/SpoIIIE
MGRRHLDGEVSDRGPIEVGRRSFSLSLKAQVGLWIAGALASLIRKLTTHVVGLSIVVNGVLFVRGGLQLAALFDGAVLALMGVWLRLDHESYNRRVTQRIRGWWRGVNTYRPGWEETLTAEKVKLSGKTSTRKGVMLPVIRHVRSTKGRDVLRVRMLRGQVLSDWVEVAHRIAVAFGCREDSARIGSVQPWRPSWWPAFLGGGKETPREIQLSFLHDDPLADVVEAHPPAALPDFKALPVARCEDGSWFRLRLLGRHLLIVGATGAGKGSVLWAIITQLIGGLSGEMRKLVHLAFLDPKGGIELGMGLHVADDFCRGRTEDIEGGRVGGSVEEAFALFLEKYVVRMRQRQDRMFGKWRLHKPTLEEPYIVIVIDELASLVAKAYVTDQEWGKRVLAAINILLSQGRAQAISIVGAVQDPRKESVPMRGLFTDRIGLFLAEASDVDLSLGDGARARGAWCDKIRRDRPGTAYAVGDGALDPVRMRFPWTSDEQIQRLPAAVGRLRRAPIDTPVQLTPAPAETVVDSGAPSWLPDEFKTGESESGKGDAA